MSAFSPLAPGFHAKFRSNSYLFQLTKISIEQLGRHTTIDSEYSAEKESYHSCLPSSSTHRKEEKLGHIRSSRPNSIDIHELAFLKPLFLGNLQWLFGEMG